MTLTIVATTKRRPAVVTEWRAVKCPECGRMLCEISPGSIVKLRCRHCRVYVVKDAA